MRDLTFSCHSSIWLLASNNDAAREWIDEHIQYEQIWGSHTHRQIVVEPRYVEAIINGAEDDGFTVDVEVVR